MLWVTLDEKPGSSIMLRSGEEPTAEEDSYTGQLRFVRPRVIACLRRKDVPDLHPGSFQRLYTESDLMKAK